jgi:hypothetical protein
MSTQPSSYNVQTLPTHEGIPSNISLPGGAADEQMKRLLREKKAAKAYQDRRRDEWDENYTLARNKVSTNRLTQRQTTNIPLMKETIKTSLSKIDDMPAVDWKEKKGDMYKSMIVQSMWADDVKQLNLEGVDLLDKKNVLLYGRSFKKLNWIPDKGLEVRVMDIFDILVDPLTDPLNLETARYIIHQNIFRSLRDIVADERYDKSARDILDNLTRSPEGIVQGDKNREEWNKKMERIKEMGFDQADFALFGAGDVIVNLTEHITREWNKQEKKYERHVVVYANERIRLMDELLENAIGVDFYPYVTWADDMETQDFWSDSVADLVRTPNKIINVWFSQLTENRTLKNFQMHWYDATVQGYAPQTYEPGPGRMLPAPGDPSKTIKPVDVSGLDDTMGAIDFIVRMVERASSTSGTDKGVMPQKQVRKAEIQAVLQKAQERTVLMARFYNRSWQDFCQKWIMLKIANQTGKQTLHKISHTGKIWPKIIYPNDWKSEAGFEAMVRSTSEQEGEKSKGVQKWMFVMAQFPQNQSLKKIAQKRMLGILDMTPEEIREVNDEEKKNQGQPQLGGAPQQSPEADQMKALSGTVSKLKSLGV